MDCMTVVAFKSALQSIHTHFSLPASLDWQSHVSFAVFMVSSDNSIAEIVTQAEIMSMLDHNFSYKE